MRRLIIDIGTNSVLGLLIEFGEGRQSVIFDIKATTRLGQGLRPGGKLSKNAIERTIDEIVSILAKDSFDSAFLIGTEALRSASNSDEFRVGLHRETGLFPIIVSGEKEAELNFHGALFGLGSIGDELLVVDVGGGSTEFAAGNSGKLNRCRSIPLGAASLFAKSEIDSLEFYKSRAAEILIASIQDFELKAGLKLIATGGTITSIAALHTGQVKYDSQAIHGMTLCVKEIMTILSRFEKTPAGRRRDLIPLDPERADLILPGGGIFLSLLGILRRERLVVSTGGLRFGTALFPQLLDK